MRFLLHVFWFAEGKKLFLLENWLDFSYRCLGSFREGLILWEYRKNRFLLGHCIWLWRGAKIVYHILFLGLWIVDGRYSESMGGKINTILSSFRLTTHIKHLNLSTAHSWHMVLHWHCLFDIYFPRFTDMPFLVQWDLFQAYNMCLSDCNCEHECKLHDYLVWWL